MEAPVRDVVEALTEPHACVDGDGMVASIPTNQTTAFAEAQLRGLAETRSEVGPVAIVWTVRGILICLKMAMHLKPSVDLRDPLADAARLFFGDAGEHLAGLLQSGNVPLPGVKVLRSARLRLDQCSMLFERILHDEFYFIRYVMPDSSPQLGRICLCVREDRLRYPRSLMFDAAARAAIDLNSVFETRRMPLSTLAHGHESALNKSTNMAGLYLNESRDLDQFDAKRSEVFGLTSDQGAEKDIVDSSVHVVPGYRDRFEFGDNKYYLWPRALFVVGHLHVLFNALEEACKGSPDADWFFDALRTICNFLSDVQLRRRFQAKCLVGKACFGKFSHFARTHIDWRWETLGPALLKVLELLPFMAMHFDLDAMLQSETGKSTSSELRALADVLLEFDRVMLTAASFLATAKVVEHYTSMLEGCHCHWRIWMQKRSFRARAREVANDTGFAHCVWKGRRAAWWIAEGLDQFLDSIRVATSDEFEKLLANATTTRRNLAVVHLEGLRARLAEIIVAKMYFWSHIPWRLIGVFYCCVGGTVIRSKEILRECIAEYDRVVNAGNASHLHQVAVRLLGADGICGIELRLWLVSDQPIISFANA